MKKAIIVSGGNISFDFALDFLKKNKTEDTCLMAADHGLDFLAQAGIEPDVAVGDFDSLSEFGKIYLEGLKHTEIIRLKPEKDDSDTQSAASLAIDRGMMEIEILGATGNRFDHLLANLGLLVLGKQRGASLAIVDPYNYAKIIPSGTILEKEEQFGQYVSFFPLDGDVTGFTLRGFKYNIQGYRLSAADSGLTVSNEIAEEKARVEYESGTLLMIMTRDGAV